MGTNNGGEPVGNDFDWGQETDDGLDLNFGPDTSSTEESDLNLSDVEQAVVTDLSGAPAKTVQAQAPANTPDQSQPAAATTTPPSGQQPPQQPPAPNAQQQPAAQQPPASSEQSSATAPQQAVDIETYVTQNSEAIIDNLAKSHFAIDDATAESLGFAPEVKGWIEKQNAKNFLVTMVQVNKALQQTLPSVVANLVNLTQQAKHTEDAFFGEFPDLRKPEVIPHLSSIARTLRGLHPNLDAAQFQTLLGNTAMQMLNIQRAAQPNAQGGPGKRLVRAPARPFAPAGSAVPQRNMGGNGTPPADPLTAMNQFLRMDADDYS